LPDRGATIIIGNPLIADANVARRRFGGYRQGLWRDQLARSIGTVAC
jgi:hypothetical protein